MMRNSPLTWVGVAGFDPAASSSRTGRAGVRLACLQVYAQVGDVRSALAAASDRA